MKLLMGIPAFRLPELVRRTISPCVMTPADILVIDNGSDQAVKATLMDFSMDANLRTAARAPERFSFARENRISIITNKQNTFCNGAWNQILEYGLRNGHDVISLNTDVSLHGGWYEVVEQRASLYSKEVWLPRIGPHTRSKDPHRGCLVQNIAGSCVFLPREAAKLVYPIPAQLRQWFGDQYMFTVLRNNGWGTVVLDDMTGDHQWTRVTEATPEAYAQIEQDKIEWEKIKW